MATPVEMAQWYANKGDVGGAIRALQRHGNTGTKEDFEAVGRLAAEVRNRTSKERDRNMCDALIEHARTSIDRLSEPPPAQAGGANGATDGGSASETKICPRCAESVKQAAVVCRFCGYVFTTFGVPANEDPAATSGVAIAAFVTSLLGLWVAGIPLGIYAQRTIDRSKGRIGGRGFATAGIVLGILGIFGTIILILALVNAAHNTPGCTYTYNATGACVPGT